MNNKLLRFGILCMIAAALISIISHASAQTTNQTSANQTTTTDNLLKAILNEHKLQIQLQQSNANVIATKLDIIKVLLEQIKTGLANPIPPPPPGFGVPLPPGPGMLRGGTPCQLVNNTMMCPFSPPPPFNPGCGNGTDNTLCHVPIPPQLQSPTINGSGTTCKPYGDAGVLIYCPPVIFPGLGHAPPPFNNTQANRMNQTK